MNSIYMNNYKDMMENLHENSDIPTGEELLLFSEAESEIEDPIELKNPIKTKSNI